MISGSPFTRRYGIDGVDWRQLSSLFVQVQWGQREPADIAAAFAKSSHVIFIYDAEQLVAFGRTMDDGRYYALLVDVVVAPSHQKRGLGREVVDYLRTCVASYNFVTLTSAPGKDGFYRQLGWLPQSSAMIWPASEQQRRLHTDERSDT